MTVVIIINKQRSEPLDNSSDSSDYYYTNNGLNH